MLTSFCNQVVEISLSSPVEYADPFNQVAIRGVFTAPDGKSIVLPAFWAGGEIWKLRFSPKQLGEYQYKTVCSDAQNYGLHGLQGKINVMPYPGRNPLFKHGRLEVMNDHRHLQFADGMPFFWLADTWWMGFTDRLSFPDDFRQLTADRVEKHFSVIQIVAGLYPDMDWYDDRGRNEAGFPWSKGFETINPAYFDCVDLRIAYLVEQGLVPCIVGSWGYFMDFAGMEILKKHWEYLIARYSAYPVVWCAAGEGMMKYYLADSNIDPEEWKTMRKTEWSALINFIREKDGHQRLVTIHPTNYGREQLSDANLIDFEMLQTGHGGYLSLGPTVDMLEKSLDSEPKMPVFVSEVNYEGICESAREEMQRFHFWSSMLSGAMGHTYGANGLWQVNSKEKPYGKSPHGTSWGDLPWQEAAQLSGSQQLGLGRMLMEQFDWWKMKPHPEWVNLPATHKDRHGCYMAGIPGKLRIMFYPVNVSWVAWKNELIVTGIEEGLTYQAFYFDPKTGKQYDLGDTNEKTYVVPKPPIFQDWVLVMVAESTN